MILIPILRSLGGPDKEISTYRRPYDKFKCLGLLSGTLEYPTLFLEPFLPSMTYVYRIAISFFDGLQKRFV